MTKAEKRIENRFHTTLNKLLKAIRKFVGTAQEPEEILERLKLYSSSKAFQDWCESLALNMTTQVKKSVDATWHESLLRVGRRNELYSAIVRELETPNGGVFFGLVRQNAEMIKTFPLDVSEEVTRLVANAELQGRRASDIAAELSERFPDIAKSRLELIARTEVSKTQSELTQARAASLGLDWYIWRASKDARVRSSHDFMDGVLVNWNDPPNPEALDPKSGQKPYGKYHAGNTFNCRCDEEVIVDLDYVDFPARVYRNNTIIQMTRAAFEEIM
ncbi:hypothetical protein FACS1894187_07050 [Synergistales bacterium]|nr:hypothetical protein FACS1894187_07050 [Synergistales bacterium]